MFKKKFPIAWAYHKNTERSVSTLLSVDEKKIPEAPFKEYLEKKVVYLLKPATATINFYDVLTRRNSCREFSDSPIAFKSLSSVLYYGYGVKEKLFVKGIEFLKRFVPSGGGLYSLELYVIARKVKDLEAGIYHYSPSNHSLELIEDLFLPGYFVTHLFLDQPYVAHAGALIIACSTVNRCMQKYEDRGYRYILLEAGHVFQNINLSAASLSLGTLNIGGFYDADMIKLLKINDEEEVPLYAMAIGNVDETQTENTRGLGL